MHKNDDVGKYVVWYGFELYIQRLESVHRQVKGSMLSLV